MKIGSVQKNSSRTFDFVMGKKLHPQISTNNRKQLRLRSSSRRLSILYFFDQVELKTCVEGKNSLTNQRMPRVKNRPTIKCHVSHWLWWTRLVKIKCSQSKAATCHRWCRN